MNKWEVADFCKELAIMVRAGMNLEEAIEFIGQDSSEDKYKSVIEKIKLGLKKGKSIDRALRSTGEFPKYMIALIEIGLIADQLEDVLDTLIHVYQREVQFERSLKRALNYPIYLVGAMSIAMLLLAGKILPIFKGIFNNWEGRGTTISAALIRLSNLMSVGTGIVFAILIILIAVKIFLIKSNKGRAMSFWIVDCMSISERINQVRFALAMNLLLKSGLDIETSLRKGFNVIENKLVQERVRQCIRLVAEKHIFDEAIEKSRVFPKQNTTFIVNSFKHGQLQEALKQIGEEGERSVQYILENKVIAIETFSVGMTCIVLIGILMTIMLPLISIISML